MDKKLVGKITHYFSKIGVAVVEASDTIRVGDEIAIEGSEGEALEQKVESMQIEHKEVPEVKAGQAVGMKVAGKVQPNNLVYKKC